MPTPLRDTWGRHAISRRVVLLVAFGVTGPLVLLGFVGFQGLSAAEAWLRSERRARAETIASRVDAAVAEGLAGLAGAAVGLDAAGGETAGVASAQDALHRVRLRSRLIEQVALVDAEARLVLSEPPGSPPDGVPPGALRRAVASGRPTVVSGAEAAAPVAWLLLPARDWRGQASGVVVGTARPASGAWTALLGSPGLGSGSVDLVDEHGAVIASTVPERLGARSEAVTWLGEGAGAAPAAQVHVSSHEGVEVLAWAPLRSAPWGVLVRQPDDEAFVELHRLERGGLVAAPVLALLALALAWGAARSVTRPLGVLVSEAERLTAGDLGDPIPDLGPDEVGRLGRALEAMRAALAGALESERRANSRLEQRVAERTAQLEGLYEELSERDRRRGQLLSRLIRAQEDERKRIARDLHDQTSQELAALVMRLDSTPPDADPDELRTRLGEARDLGRRSLEALHETMLALRPSVLDDLGLVSAIAWLAERLLGSQGVAVRCEVEGMETGPRLSSELETAVFRAAQEALVNVARHARAETVLIQVALAGGRLRVEIEDDGVGFDPGTVAEPGPGGRGLGLLGMRERVELFGGSLEVDAAEGEGTRLVLSVPVSDDDAGPRRQERG